jgi:hypothetical protein
LRRLLAVALLCWGVPALAQVVVNINGDTAVATIALPKPGGGTYNAEFRVDFDNPVNLTVACLGLSADVLDAFEIADIDARLPDPANMEIDPAFPIRVTVEPPSGCGLQFDNDIEIEFRADDLSFAPFSPYRLVKAPVTLAYRDITRSVTAGSVRTRGTGDGFSEFVIVRDLLQDYPADAAALFDALASEVDDDALTIAAQQALTADLETAHAAFIANDFAAAIASLQQFEARTRTLAGDGIPNRWRAQRDLIDDTAELLRDAGALIFVLNRLNGVP